MAVRNRDLATLDRELHARAEAGFDVRRLDDAELAARWGLVGRGAIESAAGASVDPYRLCHRALDTIARRGGQVYDRTDVVGYELSPRRVRITTDRGTSVTAKHAVVATGYEVTRLLPHLPVRLHSSFALVTEPIPEIDRRYPDGLLFWDLDDPYLYGRITDDQRLLVGGKDETYRNPLRRRRAMPAKTRALAAAVPKRLPTLGPAEVAFSWSGTFAETPDGLAYIGTHADTPRCHYALGFGGNGITYSALAAEYIADGIDGCYPDNSRLFDLARPEIEPST